MKIQIKNLGVLKQAEFSLGDMTILCGGNNTGKTYATYALFGFLSLWQEAFSVDIDETVIAGLLDDGTVSIDITPYIKNAGQILSDGCKSYTQRLPMVFAAPIEHFKDAEFQIFIDSEEIHSKSKYESKMRSANVELFSVTKSAESNELVITLLVEAEKVKVPTDIIKDIIGNSLLEVIFGHLFPNPFIASAERTGTAIFRKELNFQRNRLMEEFGQTNKNVNPIEILFKVYKDYALPVTTNVEFTRDLETIAKKRSFIAEQHTRVLTDFADIIGGEYTVTQNDELYFIPKGKQVKLSMGESSSAVRSLLDIGFYLRHVARPGDLLMVDEPELNLHPENQRRLARLFAQLVNLGIKVFITTHSDYIIKELNTLIMLNHEKPYLKKIAENEKYKKEELISADQIKVYIAEEALIKQTGSQRRTRCLTLTPADIHPDLGIEARSFDTTIDDMNRIHQEIIWGDEEQ